MSFIGIPDLRGRLQFEHKDTGKFTKFSASLSIFESLTGPLRMCIFEYFLVSLLLPIFWFA